MGGRSALASRYPVVDLESRYLRHRWVSREAEWIAWSVPNWMRNVPITVAA